MAETTLEGPLLRNIRDIISNRYTHSTSDQINRIIEDWNTALDLFVALLSRHDGDLSKIDWPLFFEQKRRQLHGWQGNLSAVADQEISAKYGTKVMQQVQLARVGQMDDFPLGDEAIITRIMRKPGAITSDGKRTRDDDDEDPALAVKPKGPITNCQHCNAVVTGNVQAFFTKHNLVCTKRPAGVK